MEGVTHLAGGVVAAAKAAAICWNLARKKKKIDEKGNRRGWSGGGDGRKGGGGRGVSAVMRSCWLDPPTEEREEHVAFQGARGCWATAYRRRGIGAWHRWRPLPLQSTTTISAASPFLPSYRADLPALAWNSSPSKKCRWEPDLRCVEEREGRVGPGDATHQAKVDPPPTEGGVLEQMRRPC
jgi:hypothetical protein